jgi:hypothetical protein
LTAFCDDVFTGPNTVTVAVHPSSARPGDMVRIDGVSDCGEGQLRAAYETATGTAAPVQLSWTHGPGSLSAFSGAFVVPVTSPGVINVTADAYCLDASYENTATADLTVLGGSPS